MNWHPQYISLVNPPRESSSVLIRLTKPAVKLIAENNNAPFAMIGRVGGSQLQVTVGGEKVVEAAVAQLESAWREGLENQLHADALAVV